MSVACLGADIVMEGFTKLARSLVGLPDWVFPNQSHDTKCTLSSRKVTVASVRF
jgi:hypothetical protein